jgi:hypothetical protein
MAQSHLNGLGLEKSLGIERRLVAPLQLFEHLRVAGHQARLEQTGLHRDVGARLGHALVDRADAAADLEAEVPQQLHQFLELAAGDGVGRLGQQDQQVDVGVGEQLAAPVAADTDQRAGAW